jgi:hypothetical protein
LEKKKRLSVHRGLGRLAYEPLIYVLFVRSDRMKRSHGSPGSQWEMTRGAPIYKIVDEEEMIVLRMESTLETGRST